MPKAKESLLEVLRETRALLARPDNDFNWSSWESAADALAELDGFISHIEAGRSFDGSKLSILFAPTADIQEVSVSSGWGDEFCRIAERFDSAFAQYEATRKTVK
jgi:hypothetical protein